MAEDFDPYHVWLGIPPNDQPANYYRLLSLNMFETSADVIDSAADRQMAHLRTFQSGKHGELTQQLLNEVAAARICLLDPKKRAAYDQQLRAKLAATTASAPATGATPRSAGGSAIQRQPPRRPGALPTAAAAPAASVPVATALPQPANDWDDLLGDPTANPANRPARKSSVANAAKGGAAKRAANNRNMSIGIAAAVLLIAAAGIGWLVLNGSSSEGTLVFDWPSDEKTDATVTVDDVPLPAPASGAWEYHGPAGSHHVVALRPAYKLDANVVLAAGQRQTAPADWKPKATLVLSWPPALRTGAELKIDGRRHAVTQHDPLELAVEPGPHVVQVTRPDSAPIVRSLTVAPEGRALVAIAPATPSTAKLVFDWTADERKNAELIIDGHSQTTPTGSEGATIELTLDPGRHVVRIARTGFEPFKQTIDLVPGEDQSVKPTWTPVQTVATTTAETQPPVETPAEQPAKKLPIPSAADQEKIAKQLDDLYKSSRSGSKDPAKAQELFDLAAKAGASAAERYVLLVKGAELAAAAGDVNLSLQGVGSLDAEFEIDALEAKQKLLDKFVNAGKPEQVEAAIAIAEQLMDQAVGADRYALAIEFSMTASRAATKSKTPTRKEIDERLSRRRHEIHILEPLFAAAKTAQETLAKNPADAEANLNLGRWLCFYKGDWTAGLPLLAKGSDEKLKSLAEQELKAPTDAEQQARLADAWWELASKESGIARDSIHLHAGDIYQTASPNLTSALRKAAIEKRLAEIADLKPAVGAAGANDSTAAGKTVGATAFPLNQWVDVLRLVDTTKNAVGGKWSRAGKEIDVAPSGEARIAIPVVVDGSYDLAVVFNRVQGSGEVRISIPVGSHACNFEWGLGADSGLDIVDGHRPNDADNPTKVTSRDVANGRAYQVLVKVRLLGTDRASVDVLVDGKPYLPHWEGNPAALTVHGYWTMPTPDHLGLGAWNSQVAFGLVRLRMVSGHASADDLVAGSAAPQLAPPTVNFKQRTGAIKFPLKQWVDIIPLIDTARDRVGGDWSLEGTDLHCSAPDGGGKIAFPLSVDGGYDLEVEFTRTSGNKDVATMFSIASHPSMISLSAWDGAASGLLLLDGKGPNEESDPIAVRPGPLENGRRYRLRLSARVLASDRASLEVSLDGKPYLPRWEGNPAVLSLHQSWAMPNPRGLGLGVGGGDVTFHSVRLRMVSGHAILANDFRTSRVGGDGGGEFEDRAPADGLLVGFRIVTAGPVNQLQPIYRTRQGIVPGQNYGHNGGTEISATAKDGYAVGAIVAKSGDAVDGFKAVFMRIRGKGLDPGDSYPSEWLGGQGGGGETTLSAAGGRIVGVYGRSGDWINALGLIFEEAPAAAPAAATVARGFDLLARVDANRDSIEGRWERRGGAIFCNDSASGGDRRFLEFPTEIAEARYDLRVEFSRDSGDDCFAVGFPVGERGAEFLLSDIRGKFSGLEKIDGHALDDPANPTARSPSNLENGKRYVVRIVVSVQRDTAKVNCFLDGDELVVWKGNVDSLDQNSAWKTAPHRIGVGEWNSPSTIYSASVRGLK